MKKLFTLLTALLLTLSCITPAPAETTTEHLSARAYMAGLDALAAEAGGTLEWTEEPFPPAPELTAITCRTLGDSPVLIVSGDTLVMIAASVPFEASNVQGSFDTFMGALICTLLPVLIADGMTHDEAILALHPFVNGEGFIPGVISALRGEEFWFTFCGYDGLVAMVDDADQPMLCLYLYTEPSLLPRL